MDARRVDIREPFREIGCHLALLFLAAIGAATVAAATQEAVATSARRTARWDVVEFTGTAFTFGFIHPNILDSRDNATHSMGCLLRTDPSRTDPSHHDLCDLPC